MGEGFVSEGYRIDVIEQTGNSFLVRVAGQDVDGFTDIAESVHKESVTKLADLGFTDGCDITGRLYCPDRFATRAQVAKILMLASGETFQDDITGVSRFVDVPEGAWYRPYVERMAALGVAYGFEGTGRSVLTGL